MRRSSYSIVVFAISVVVSCRSGGVPLPPADAIVQGRTTQPVKTDTIEGNPTVSIDPGRFRLRQHATAGDFWTDIAVLDIPGSELSAKSVNERTFSTAMKTLMDGDPEAASVAFRALHLKATDPVVHARARIGLTMALSWQSDWPSLAHIGADSEAVDPGDSLAIQAGVERWGRALSSVAPPYIEVPDAPVTIPMRRSAFGTPVVTVRINGKEHEFWLDTGASMTLLSDAVAAKAGVKLASQDTLALGVVAGHIPARAVYIDSIAMGPVVARGLGAALVSHGALRLDHKMVNGVRESVEIDGVIGTDIIRYLDLVVDARAGTITIRKPTHDPKAVRNLFWVGYPVVRLVTKDGQPVLFGLDTGAEATYVTTSLLHKLPDTPVAMRRGSINGLGSEEHKTEWVARDVELSDGDYAMSLHNIPVAPERRWTFVNFDGVIGSDIALGSRLHLDFLNGVFDVRRSSVKPVQSGGINVIITP